MASGETKAGGLNYYNEFDPKAAAWLRELIKVGEIPAGDVDERSITNVEPTDLDGYTQCHFFAGIGGWSLALRLAAWPDNRPAWTGSCPCQPFSSAGKGLGEADERHIWPFLRNLIGECRPSIVFGEQVASKAGREWLFGIRAHLEALAYGLGASDLCAASVGAPHIRQRLFWVAYAADGHRRRGERGTQAGVGKEGERRGRPAISGEICGLEHSPGDRREQRRAESSGWGAGGGCGESGLEHTIKPGLEGYSGDGNNRDQSGWDHQGSPGPASTASNIGFWSSAIWHPCLDGKARRIEPSIFPLAHGVPERVGRLRGYGNAIVPQVAAEFIQAAIEAIHEIK